MNIQDLEPPPHVRAFVFAYKDAMEREFDLLGYASKLLMLDDPPMVTCVSRAAELGKMLCESDTEFELALERVACKHTIKRRPPRFPWPSDAQLQQALSLSFYNAIDVTKDVENSEVLGWTSGPGPDGFPTGNKEQAMPLLEKLLDKLAHFIGTSLASALKELSEDAENNETEEDEDPWESE